MNYQNKLEDYFLNNLQKDEFILDKYNTSHLDEVIKLLTLEEQELEIEIKNRPELCKILEIEEHGVFLTFFVFFILSAASGVVFFFRALGTAVCLAMIFEYYTNFFVMFSEY